MSGGKGPPAQLPGAAGAAPLPKRFYTAVTVAPAEAAGGSVGHRILLDGRPVRTPGKRPVDVPTAALADALAEEWRAQGQQIDPRSMPLTRIVNSALDGVAGREREVAEDIARYAGSDLVCYRADHPAELAARQAKAWDTLLDWAAASYGVRLATALGIMHVTQDPEIVRRVAERISQLPPLAVAAVHVMTTLTGSAIIATAHAAGAVDRDAAWAAAHIDEDWQVAQWGEDAEASARRAARRLEFDAASRVYELCGAAAIPLTKFTTP